MTIEVWNHEGLGKVHHELYGHAHSSSSDAHDLIKWKLFQLLIRILVDSRLFHIFIDFVKLFFKIGIKFWSVSLNSVSIGNHSCHQSNIASTDSKKWEFIAANGEQDSSEEGSNQHAQSTDHLKNSYIVLSFLLVAAEHRDRTGRVDSGTKTTYNLKEYRKLDNHCFVIKIVEHSKSNEINDDKKCSDEAAVHPLDIVKEDIACEERRNDESSSKNRHHYPKIHRLNPLIF